MLFQIIQTIRVTFINNILRGIPPPALPEFTSVNHCDHFSKYFVHKIAIILSKFAYEVPNIAAVQNETEIESKMKDFECATEYEIKKPFLGLSSKSCDLNSIPTRVRKNCLDILITPMTDKINILMEKFPKNYTDAHIRPPGKNIAS